MKKTIRAEVNKFIKGLITEASVLNYPDNASLEEENFELNKDGTRDRRLGLDFEPGFILRPTILAPVDADNANISTFRWVGVRGNSEEVFLVVQLNQQLQFYDLNEDVISDDGFIGTLTLSSFPSNIVYSFTSVEGSLIVAAGAQTVAIVSYDGTLFNVEYDSLKVRDSWGVQVTTYPQYETDASYRGAYEPRHYYNLQNQSWGVPRVDSAGVYVDPTNKYFTDLGVYPSNSELVWAGLQFQPVTAGVTFERMYTNLYTEVLGSTVIASKGYYVIDLLNRGASREAQFASNNAKYPILAVPTIDLPQDYTTGGAKVVAEYAGRVWYAGFGGQVTDGDSRSPNLSNFVVFSKLVKDKTDLVKCYQEGDPSSRESSDLVDTDGGFIRISGVKNILSLINLDSSLVVLADNGVWSITGGNDYGFSATNYKVTKISAFGGLSNSSVVVDGGRAFFWSFDGIYLIGKNELGSFTVTNITENTIQTYYQNIDSSAKEGSVGVYDPINKKVRWLFQENTRFTDESLTKELVLDTNTSAFSINTIKKLSPNIVEPVSLFPSTPFRRGSIDYPVYSESDEVFSSTDTVVASTTIRITGLQSVRYLCIVNDNLNVTLAFAYYNEPLFRDWYSVNGFGVDAKGFMLTGEQIAGDSAVSKQVPALVMHFVRTESGVTPDYVPDNQSSCLVRFRWDFANTIASNKWSAPQECYRYRRAQYIEDLSDTYDNGFSIVTSRTKIRGRGKSFSMYLETSPMKDCRVVGWNLSLTGNPNG